VDMIRRNGAFENFNILFGADSTEQVSGAKSEISCEYSVSVLGEPYEVDLKIKDCMGAFAIFCGHRNSILEVIA
jgi:hypothetical protein